jgi:hypothetical protein
MLRPQKKMRREWRALAALVLAAGASRGLAQEAGWGIYQEDPLWTLLIPHLAYIKTDVEAQQSTYHSSAGGSVPNLTWLSVQPAVGIQWNNYIYNPDLLNYSLLFEPGYYWQQTQSGSSSYQTEELMLNGNSSVRLLAIKPYATTFSYSRSHEDVRYDFFNSETVDSQNWGVFTGYRDGPVPVTVDFEHLDENRNAYNQNFDTSQIKLDLHATNERSNQDHTELDYQFNQYDNQTQGGGNSYSSESSSHHVVLTDLEYFKKSTLSSIFYFTSEEWKGSDSSELNATLNLNVEHTPHLRSFYNYTVSDNFGNGYDSIQNNALAGISHQLYDSLVSRLDVHGSKLNSSFTGSSLDSTSVGTSASVDYNKRLGNWAHLSFNSGVTYDLTDQQASGLQTTIPDESYTLPATGPLIIRLRTPGVVAITSITKNNVPLDSSEWAAITGTDPWQIQFFGGGVHSIVNGDVLSVTYVVQSNPSGNYSVFTYQGQIGLRFWKERAGIHAGYSRTMNHADAPGFILQDVNEIDTGADVNWHGLSANASYMDQHATYSSTRTSSLGEGYSTPVSSHSNIGINFNQQWNHFSGGTEYGTVQPQDMAFYSYMLHYDWHPVGGFSLNTEAGYQQQHGGNYDEDLFAARFYLDWMVGKLEFHLGYQHDDQQFTTETREQDYVFLRMRRNF